MSTRPEILMFTPAQVEQFRTQGYSAVPDFGHQQKFKAMQA
jgi:hypothetical protein